ncbi:unnamed protein product [Caenorhabditis nigoni]
MSSKGSKISTKCSVFEHPWFNNASSKRNMIMDYSTEMNAHAQEKLGIIGDEESVTEFDEISQRCNDTWSSASESRRRAATEGFKVPVLPPNVDPFPPETPHQKKPLHHRHKKLTVNRSRP